VVVVVVVQAGWLGSPNLVAAQVVARTGANLLAGPPKLVASDARPPAQLAGPPAGTEVAAARPATFDTNVSIMHS
jgi:hypothetical protein